MQMCYGVAALTGGFMKQAASNVLDMLDGTWGMSRRVRTAGRRPLGACAASADRVRQPSSAVARRTAARSVWRTNGPFTRDLNNLKVTTKIKKATRPAKLRQTFSLLAEDVLGPSVLSEEEDDGDDAMDPDNVPGRAAGRELPSRGPSKKRTSTRQAGAKRPRQQSPSDEEDEHTERSSKRARTRARAGSASSGSSSQAAVLASQPGAHQAYAGPALPALHVQRYKEGSVAGCGPNYQAPPAYRPRCGTASPDSSTTAILLPTFPAAAVAAAFGDLPSDDGEAICEDILETLLREDLSAAAGAAALRSSCPQPADPTTCAGKSIPAWATSAAAPVRSDPVPNKTASVEGSSSPEWAHLIGRCPHRGIQALAGQWLAEPPLGVVPPLKKTDFLL